MRVKNHLTQIYGEAPRLWIEICRAGDYSKAGKGVITPDDLHRVVRNYDPSYHEAPVTIGHPVDDKPAYAWIDGLMVDGRNLLARETQVDPKFNEARHAGKFKKRSAAFYCDDRGNITGLRHVAWLGAQPPEIKGLSEVAFDDHGSKFITVDFGEDKTVAGEKSVTEQVKEAMRGLFAEMFRYANARINREHGGGFDRRRARWEVWPRFSMPARLMERRTRPMTWIAWSANIKKGSLARRLPLD